MKTLTLDLTKTKCQCSDLVLACICGAKEDYYKNRGKLYITSKDSNAGISDEELCGLTKNPNE